MEEAYIGSIVIWSAPFEPVGWMYCDGRLLQINQYQALYSLIGNTYGGTPPQTFALPDLRGKVILGAGLGAGFQVLGAKGGSAAASITLNPNNIPAHTHPAVFTPSGSSDVKVQASSNLGGNTYAPSATNKYLAASPANPNGAQMWSNTLTNPVDLGGVSGGGATGGTVAVNNNTTTNTPISVPTQPPYLALNFIICVNGLYPQRS